MLTHQKGIKKTKVSPELSGNWFGLIELEF